MPEFMTADQQGRGNHRRESAGRRRVPRRWQGLATTNKRASASIHSGEHVSTLAEARILERPAR
jgi:hypothetical protein